VGTSSNLGSFGHVSKLELHITFRLFEFGSGLFVFSNLAVR